MRILNVRAQTLYAYVSRGWIRSIPQKGKKDRLYPRDDIERVGMRALARSGHGAAAASAMNWGEPIFPTSVTEITARGPRYRGHLAADLVRSGASFESVAELLWSGELQASSPSWPVFRPGPELARLTRTLSSLPVRSNMLETFGLVVVCNRLTGIGPVEDAAQLEGVLVEAIAAVRKGGIVVVDVVVQTGYSPAMTAGLTRSQD